MADTITVPADQFQRMQQQLAQLESERAMETSARQAAEAQSRIARGEAEAVVKTFQSKIQAAEEEARASAADNELRKTLTGYPLVNTAAVDQLAILLGDQVTADRDQSGKLVVRGKDFRPIDEVVRDALSRPNYANFLRSGASAAPAAQPQPDNPAQPAALQAAWQQFANLPGVPLGVRVQQAALQKAEAATATGSPLDPRADLSLPFGLTRKR